MNKKELLREDILRDCFVVNKHILVDDVLEFVTEREDRAREEVLIELLKKKQGITLALIDGEVQEVKGGENVSVAEIGKMLKELKSKLTI